jgi:hypothetical protein
MSGKPEYLVDADAGGGTMIEVLAVIVAVLLVATIGWVLIVGG